MFASQQVHGDLPQRDGLLGGGLEQAAGTVEPEAVGQEAHGEQAPPEADGRSRGNVEPAIHLLLPALGERDPQLRIREDHEVGGAQRGPAGPLEVGQEALRRGRLGEDGVVGAGTRTGLGVDRTSLLGGTVRRASVDGAEHGPRRRAPSGRPLHQRRHRLRHLLLVAGGEAVEDGCEQLLLRREVVHQPGLGDAGRAGGGVQAQRAVGPEMRLGGVEHRVAGGGSVRGANQHHGGHRVRGQEKACLLLYLLAR